MQSLEATDEARGVTLALLDQLFDHEDARAVGIRLWDGTLWPAGPARANTLVLNHAGALRAMFLSGNEVGLAEAYLHDDFDIEGSVEAVFELAQGLADRMPLGLVDKLRLARELLRLPATSQRRGDRRGPSRLSGEQHSPKRDAEAIAYHYDVSNDFYRLWLDENMVYSCAYFRKADDSLDTAQSQKLDLICRKLRLRPGQTLLDIGCGWGGLVIWAARECGVDATGITLSHPQANLANQRIAEAGLTDRCRVLVQDYRQAQCPPGGYDALVSVGMFEHVGAAKLPGYFQQAWDLLKPGGVFLNHGIANRCIDPRRRGRTFSDTYVFPDGELVPINVTLNAAEEVSFEVRDVESLREHYAMTLRHWVRRLEANHEQALEFVSEPTYRVWRLFMSGSAYGFRTGRLNVYQALLAKPDAQGDARLPPTREDCYMLG